MHIALPSYYPLYVPEGPEIKIRIDKSLICDLHRKAAHGVVEWTPGRVRTEDVFVRDHNDVDVYTPPNYLEVDAKFSELIEVFNNSQDRDTEYLAALAIWLVNWVHPFYNANGRTSRALGYLVLCIGHRIPTPPGFNTFFSQLSDRKPEYVRCIRDADASYAKGVIDVSGMQAFVEELFLKQLESA